MLETLIGVVSAAIAAAAFLIGFKQWRDADLRRNEVQLWVDECIHKLALLVLIARDDRHHFSPEEITSYSKDIFISTSILAERGRIYFKNKRIDEYGSEKLAAYQGFRPESLDQLIIAHQIAELLPSVPQPRKKDLGKLAEFTERKFLTLAVAEAGRIRPASQYASEEGAGSDIDLLLDLVWEHGNLEAISDKWGRIDYDSRLGRHGGKPVGTEPLDGE